MDIYNNTPLEPAFKEINWDSKFISLCESIIKELPEKDKIFLDLYYWKGKTEKEISRIFDYSREQSVCELRDRIFARARMYATKQVIFTPPCMSRNLAAENHTLQLFSVKLRKTNTINRISEEAPFKYAVQDFIVELIKYVTEKKSGCKFCEHRKNCENRLQEHRKKYITLLKILDLQDIILEKNLENQIKLYKYLLSWKEFKNASD